MPPIHNLVYLRPLESVGLGMPNSDWDETVKVSATVTESVIWTQGIQAHQAEKTTLC